MMKNDKNITSTNRTNPFYATDKNVKKSLKNLSNHNTRKIFLMFEKDGDSFILRRSSANFNTMKNIVDRYFKNDNTNIIACFEAKVLTTNNKQVKQINEVIEVERHGTKIFDLPLSFIKERYDYFIQVNKHIQNKDLLSITLFPKYSNFTYIFFKRDKINELYSKGYGVHHFISDKYTEDKIKQKIKNDYPYLSNDNISKIELNMNDLLICDKYLWTNFIESNTIDKFDMSQKFKDELNIIDESIENDFLKNAQFNIPFDKAIEKYISEFKINGIKPNRKSLRKFDKSRNKKDMYFKMNKIILDFLKKTDYETYAQFMINWLETNFSQIKK